MPRLRFTLAELLVATFLAGALVGVYIFRNHSDQTLDLKLRVTHAAFHAPDSLYVLTFPSSPINEHIVIQVLKINPATKSTTVISSKPLSLSRERSRLEGGYTLMLLSADGSRLCLANQYHDPVEIWDARSGTLLKELPLVPARRILALSGDGNFLLLGTIYGPSCRVDTATGAVTDDTRDCPGVLTFLPGDKRVVCRVGKTITIREFPSGKPLAEFTAPEGDDGSLGPLEIAADSKMLLLCIPPNFCRAFDLQTDLDLGLKFDNVERVALDQDGRYIAAFVKVPIPFVTITDRRGTPLHAFPVAGDIKLLALPARGKLLLVYADGKIELHRFATTTPEIILYAFAAAALLALITLRLRSRPTPNP